MLIMTRIPNTNQQWADYSLVGVMLVADMVLCRGGKANCCDNLHSDTRQSALLQYKHQILFHNIGTHFFGQQLMMESILNCRLKLLGKWIVEVI